VRSWTPKATWPPLAAVAVPVARVVPGEVLEAPVRSWKVKACVPLSGAPSTVLRTATVPRLALVNVTRSPAAMRNVAVSAAASVVLSVSSHATVRRS
jgi:hypothetical protein